MDNKGKLLLKNIGILTVSNFASKILVFLLVPLYTSILSTNEYGIYDLAITTISLLFPVMTLNIIDAMMRFMMDDSYDKCKVASIGVVFCLMGIVLGTLFLAVLHWFDLYRGIRGLEIYIFLYYVFYMVNQYMIQFTKGLDKVMDMGIAGVLGTLIMILTNILFLIVFKWGLHGFFVANTLCQAIPASYLIIRTRLWSYINLRESEKKLAKEMLAYCVPLIVTSVGWWVNSGSDRYVVTFFCGVAANGVLSVSYKIPTILNTLQGIFIQAWQISAVKEFGKEDIASFYGKTFTIINLLMCGVCSWLIILTKPIAHLLYSKDFYQAWQYVPFLLMASVLNSASGMLGPILSAKKDSKAMMWSAIIGAGSNLILNIVLVFKIGIQGATIATVICSYIIYVIRKNAVGTDIKIDRYIIILSTWGLLFVQAIVECYLSNYTIEIAIMIILLVINIKPMKQLWFTSIKIIKSFRK